MHDRLTALAWALRSGLGAAAGTTRGGAEPRHERDPWTPHARRPIGISALLLGIAWSAAVGVAGCGGGSGDGPRFDGKEVFRHDTFGSEQHWTQNLDMARVIRTAVDPTTALAVGLKVDADALPPGLLAQADLTDPATTVELIRLGAVVGVEGQVDANGTLTQVGITCALCHSTVDDSVMPGIGRRIDGAANRQLDPGRILSLSPALQDPATQAVLLSWGPGRFDPYFNLDGLSEPVLIPPIYGLQGVALETYTGEGPISYWNAYVAVTQMGGQGAFVEPRLGLNVQPQGPDLVTPKLPALLDYQLTLHPPPRPAGSFDTAAAARGEQLFSGKADCARCHDPSAAYTDAGRALHDATETGVDPLYATRGITKQYRTTPLRALTDHAPYFHDGSAATLADVVDHYDQVLGLLLTASERSDLVEFLKSL